MWESPHAALSMITYGHHSLAAIRTGLLLNRLALGQPSQVGGTSRLSSFNPCKQVGALLFPDP
jgi:hypothetical protein